MTSVFILLFCSSITSDSEKKKKKRGPQKGKTCDEPTCQNTFTERGMYLVRLRVGRRDFTFCHTKHFAGNIPACGQLLLEAEIQQKTDPEYSNLPKQIQCH